MQPASAQRTATPAQSAPPPRPAGLVAQQAPARPVAPAQAAPSTQQAPPREHYQHQPSTTTIIERVHVPYAYGHYGKTRDNSPNRLYKKYLAWFVDKYDGTNKKPLSFKKWLVWAKSKGIINQWSADGKSPVEKTADEVGAKVVSGAGKNLVIALGVILVIGSILNFASAKNG